MESHSPMSSHSRKVRLKPIDIHELFTIKNIYFNDPVTVVLWEDGTKTIVRCDKNDIYDPEKGLAMAVAKKALGNKGIYYDEFKKWLPMQEAKNTSQSEYNESICCNECRYNDVDEMLEPCYSCLIGEDYCSEFIPRDF